MEVKRKKDSTRSQEPESRRKEKGKRRRAEGSKLNVNGRLRGKRYKLDKRYEPDKLVFDATTP
jgi:hypothetical protein